MEESSAFVHHVSRPGQEDGLGRVSLPGVPACLDEGGQLTAGHAGAPSRRHGDAEGHPARSSFDRVRAQVRLLSCSNLAGRLRLLLRLQTLQADGDLLDEVLELLQRLRLIFRDVVIRVVSRLESRRQGLPEAGEKRIVWEPETEAIERLSLAHSDGLQRLGRTHRRLRRGHTHHELVIEIGAHPRQSNIRARGAKRIPPPRLHATKGIALIRCSHKWLGHELPASAADALQDLADPLQHDAKLEDDKEEEAAGDRLPSQESPLHGPFVFFLDVFQARLRAFMGVVQLVQGTHIASECQGPPLGVHPDLFRRDIRLLARLCSASAQSVYHDRSDAWRGLHLGQLGCRGCQPSLR